MANEINGLNGFGNSYNLYGRLPKEKNTNKVKPEITLSQERQEVNPDDVMRFMANNSLIPANQTNAVGEVKANLDIETQNRIGDYMARFEEIFGLVQAEFGREHAPFIMDLVMDKLMSVAA